jgi:hypothetical protein
MKRWAAVGQFLSSVPNKNQDVVVMLMCLLLSPRGNDAFLAAKRLASETALGTGALGAMPIT